MKQKMHRFTAMGLALCAALGLYGTALAYPPQDATIDYGRTASLTVTKYDLTAATQAGVSTGGLVSTGKENHEAETMLQDYTLGGVEFTYLRLGGIDMYSDQDAANATVQVIYGVDNEDVRDTLGLTSEDVVKTEGGIPWYTPDTLIDALEEQLTANRRATKDALEAEANQSGTAMPLTDDITGTTSVDGLDLGLYLVVETEVPENVTSTVNPFLVSLPMTDTQTADGWFYDVHVYPKNESGNPTLEKEVADLAHGISFSGDMDGLGYRDVATGSTGDVMGYRYLSTLPTITSSATQLTQYRFEDILSPGLEYNRNDVIVCWYESYEAAKKDYTVATSGAAATQGANAVETWECNEKGQGTYFDVSYSDADDGATRMALQFNEAGLKRINTPVDNSQQEGRYSDWTCVVYYTAKINSTEDMILGDKGNPNTVTLTWKRTSQDYMDTLTDEAKVYSYGIHLTKKFSAGGTNFDAVRFIAQNVTNVTGNYYVVAEANPAKGVYYATGTTTNVDEATRMTPDETGHLYLYGVEEDTYQLTETQTDAGYTLLEDVITVDINTKYTPGVQVGSLTATATVDGYSATMEAMGDSGNALVPLTVLNTRGFDLPETGGKGTMVTTVVGIVLASGMLTGCIALRYWKRKGELDEKK